jgi:hypothetical protein
MADSSALGDVSKSLQNLLRSVITESADFLGVQVDLRSPKDIRAANIAGPILSLWLYRITRLDDLYNVPPTHIPPDRTVMRPLPLNLSYLVTPIAADMLTAQRLLGRAMQVMFDNAILESAFLEQSLVESGIKFLTIHMEPHSLEELTRIWHALQEPYDLSNSYLVQYMNTIVTANGRSYLVTYDRTATFGALVTGAVLDDCDGQQLAPPYTVTASDPTLIASGKARGYLLAGDPEVNLADHTVTHALTIDIDAQGFRPQTLAITVPANPLFPVAGPDANLRRRPVTLRGRVSARRTGIPVPGAQIALTGPALPAPQQLVALASPLIGDLSGAATIQGHSLMAVASPVPIKAVVATADAGTATLRLDDRQNLLGGQIIRIGPAFRPRFVQIASVSTTPPNPALPGDVTLKEPLAYSVRPGDSAAPFILGAPLAPPAHPVGNAFKGEGVLMLDAPAAGAVLMISDPAAPTDRFHARDIVCDGRGEYVLEGIARLPRLILTATAAGFSRLSQTWLVTWDSQITTFDWALVP